jgi:hypothetical protein
VAGGANQDDGIPEGYKQVSDDSVAYRFFAPLDWSVNSTDSIDSVYYSPSDPSMVMISFYAPDSEQADIDTYWASVEEQYKSLYTDYTPVSSGNTVLGKRTAIQHTFTAKIGGVEYKMMQIITGYGKHYYTMTYMSSPENFDLHLEEVNKMAEVFLFR